MSKHTPLRKTLFKVVPVAFFLGAAIELFMVYVPVGGSTFYDTAKRLEQTRRKEREEAEAQLEARVEQRRLDREKQHQKDTNADI